MYVGWGTIAGKCRWFTVFACILLSGILWIIFRVEGGKCEICDRQTDDSGNTVAEGVNCREWSSVDEEFDSATHGASPNSQHSRMVLLRTEHTVSCMQVACICVVGLVPFNV